MEKLVVKLRLINVVFVVVKARSITVKIIKKIIVLNMSLSKKVLNKNKKQFEFFAYIN